MKNVFTVCSLLIMASVLGNMTGYWFGRKAGPIDVQVLKGIGIL